MSSFRVLSVSDISPLRGTPPEEALYYIISCLILLRNSRCKELPVPRPRSACVRAKNRQYAEKSVLRMLQYQKMNVYVKHTGGRPYIITDPISSMEKGGPNVEL